jgi:hypothetical protein
MHGSKSDLPYSSWSSIVNHTIDRPLDQDDSNVFFVLCEVCFWTATVIRSNRLTDLDENGCSNCKEKQFFAGYIAHK